MSDIETSFSFIHQNIPAWVKQVAEIEDKVVRLQEELAKVPAQRSVPLKRKTNSVESLRDIDVDAQVTTSASPIPATSAATRKRKSPSVLSGNASGPSKYRSRQMIVVAYDGEIQKSFEQLVRAIGTGRNLLRKGKMAAKLEAMTALAGLHDDDDDEDVEEDGAILTSKIGYRHRTGLSAMRDRAMAVARAGVADNTSTPVQSFDSTDKALELAQNLCEKAAHQILREGDCRNNLRVVRGHMEEAQEMAKREVARHAANREEREKEEREKAEREKAEGEKQELAVTPPPTKMDPIQCIPSAQPSAEPITPPDSTNILPVDITPSDGGLNAAKTMEIEVDDEEDDGAEFVMPPLRFRTRA
ncbi:hypothetical protein DM02DRAFT_611275 [Periconia macrospinosa]|uniref:Uncharacterized protein n=1 Tax=Periconia macrospinosa TaxID=97972 RepID=A0A2V1E259_9PLEO|nr:hypothetical protein DM02DRAFT_611275 [Periconia macrospinosa]